MTEETPQPGGEQPPQSKEALLERIQQAWTQVLAMLDGVPELALVEPGVTGWSIKDNLAHITAWEQILLRHHLGGEPIEAVLEVEDGAAKGMDEAAVNDAIFLRNQRRPLAEVMQAFHGSHARVVEAMERRSFEELMAARVAGDDGTRSALEEVAGNTYEHYEHHQADIEQLLLPSVLGD